MLPYRHTIVVGTCLGTSASRLCMDVTQSLKKGKSLWL